MRVPDVCRRVLYGVLGPAPVDKVECNICFIDLFATSSSCQGLDPCGGNGGFERGEFIPGVLLLTAA